MGSRWALERKLGLSKELLKHWVRQAEAEDAAAFPGATMTTALVMQALQMTLQARKPTAGLLHHSDRRAQYASHDYQTQPKQHGITLSMSRIENCYDNAIRENAWGTLKTEFADSQEKLF